MRILVATDGSAGSQAALTFLAGFPFAEPPETIVASVCPVPDLHALGNAVPEHVQADVDLSRSQSQATIDKAAQQCRAWSRSVESVLLSGHAAQEIVLAAVDRDVHLVIAGARGLGAVNRFLLGSVSDSIARHAPCSVLIVRDRQSEPSRRGLRILMGVEDTPASQQAVRRFAALPLGAGSDVLLMSVINIIPAYHMEYTLHQQPALTSLIAHTQQSLAASADLLKGAAGRVETLVEEGVNGAEHLLARADAWKPDLIVVGSTGKAAWERVLLGSVSTRVLHHAPCSVWIERLQA